LIHFLPGALASVPLGGQWCRTRRIRERDSSPAIPITTKARPRTHRGRAGLLRLHLNGENSMKAHIAVTVTIDIAKIIAALSGFVLALAFIFRHV